MKTVFIVFSIDPSRGMRIQDVFSSKEAADQAARTLRGRGFSVGVQGWVLKEEFLGFSDAPIYSMPVESKQLEASLLKFRAGPHSYSIIDNSEEEELLDLPTPSSETEASPRDFQIGDIVRIVDPQCTLDPFTYRCGKIVGKQVLNHFEIKEGNGYIYLYPPHWLTLVAGVEKPAPAPEQPRETWISFKSIDPFRCVGALREVGGDVEEMMVHGVFGIGASVKLRVKYLSFESIKKVFDNLSKEVVFSGSLEKIDPPECGFENPRAPQHTPETVKLLDEVKTFAEVAAMHISSEIPRIGLQLTNQVISLLDEIKKNVEAILEGQAPGPRP